MPDYQALRPGAPREELIASLKSISKEDLSGEDFGNLASLLGEFLEARGPVAVFYVNRDGEGRSPLDNHSRMLDSGELDLGGFRELLSKWLRRPGRSPEPEETGLGPEDPFPEVFWTPHDRGWASQGLANRRRDLSALLRARSVGEAPRDLTVEDLIANAIPRTAETREELLVLGLKTLTETRASRLRRPLQLLAERALSGDREADPGGPLGDREANRASRTERIEERIEGLSRRLSGRALEELSTNPEDQENFRLLLEGLLKRLDGLEPEELERRKMSKRGLVGKFLGRCTELKKRPSEDGDGLLFEAIRTRAAKLFVAYETGLLSGTAEVRASRRRESRLARLFEKIGSFRDPSESVTFLESALRLDSTRTLRSNDQIWGCWVESGEAIRKIQVGILGEVHTWCYERLRRSDRVEEALDFEDSILGELALTDGELEAILEDRPTEGELKAILEERLVGPEDLLLGD